MEIKRNMDLYALAEAMGTVATIEDAEAMRDILIERGYEGMDTRDVLEDEWYEMLEAAVRRA